MNCDEEKTKEITKVKEVSLACAKFEYTSVSDYFP
jgi:hypothetical protein